MEWHRFRFMYHEGCLCDNPSWMWAERSWKHPTRSPPLQGSQVSRIERDSHSFGSFVTHSRHTLYFSRWKKTKIYIYIYISSVPLSLWNRQESSTSPIRAPVSVPSVKKIKLFLIGYDVANQKQKHYCIWVNLNTTTNEKSTSATTGGIPRKFSFGNYNWIMSYEHHRDHWSIRTE